MKYRHSGISIAVILSMAACSGTPSDTSPDPVPGSAPLPVAAHAAASDPVPRDIALTAPKAAAPTPFADIPRDRSTLGLEDDPFAPHSRAEQQWLDRHGFPNARQWETYSAASTAMLEQAAASGDTVARSMLDGRLIGTDPQAQQRLLDAGAEGDLYALQLVASYQAGSSKGDPVLGYAISRVAEMRGDSTLGLTREVMFRQPLDVAQRMRAEAEALRLNTAMSALYRARHGVDAEIDMRPIQGQ